MINKENTASILMYRHEQLNKPLQPKWETVSKSGFKSTEPYGSLIGDVPRKYFGAEHITSVLHDDRIELLSMNQIYVNGVPQYPNIKVQRTFSDAYKCMQPVLDLKELGYEIAGFIDEGHPGVRADSLHSGFSLPSRNGSNSTIKAPLSIYGNIGFAISSGGIDEPDKFMLLPPDGELSTLVESVAKTVMHGAVTNQILSGRDYENEYLGRQGA